MQFVIENFFSLGAARTLPHQQGKSMLKANKVSLCVSKTSPEVVTYSQEPHRDSPLQNDVQTYSTQHQPINHILLLLPCSPVMGAAD